MINIKVVRDEEGFIWEFTVSGHAGFDEHGKDIVCAAVSAIGYNALNALNQIVGIKNYAQKDGYLKCIVPKELSEEKKHDTRIILETIILGFKQIALSYKDYVLVLDKEVHFCD